MGCQDALWNTLLGIEAFDDASASGLSFRALLTRKIVAQNRELIERERERERLEAGQLQMSQQEVAVLGVQLAEQKAKLESLRRLRISVQCHWDFAPKVWQRAAPVIQHELAGVKRGVSYHAKRLRWYEAERDRYLQHQADLSKMQPASGMHTPYPAWLASRIASSSQMSAERATERDRLLQLSPEWSWSRHQAAALKILQAEADEVGLRFRAMVQAHTDLANQIPQSQSALVQYYELYKRGKLKEKAWRGLKLQLEGTVHKIRDDLWGLKAQEQMEAAAARYSTEVDFNLKMLHQMADRREAMTAGLPEEQHEPFSQVVDFFWGQIRLVEQDLRAANAEAFVGQAGGNGTNSTYNASSI